MTDTEKDRQRERQTDRHRQTERQTKRETKRYGAMHAMVQAVSYLTKPVHCFKQFERNKLLEMCNGRLSRAAVTHRHRHAVTHT